MKLFLLVAVGIIASCNKTCMMVRLKQVKQDSTQHLVEGNWHQPLKDSIHWFEYHYEIEPKSGVMIRAFVWTGTKEVNF